MGNEKDKQGLKPLKKVISFSLYGNRPCYQVGAVINVLEARRVLPDWTCRFYTTDNENVTNLLKYLGAEVIDMNHETDPKIRHAYRFWRFLAVDDPSVEAVLSRDADSVVSEREVGCIDRWLNDPDGVDWTWLIIRDHPGHRSVPMLAGMWGYARTEDSCDFLSDEGHPLKESMRSKILKWDGSVSSAFGDQRFLKVFYEGWIRKGLAGKLLRYGPKGLVIPPHGDTYITNHVGARTFRGKKFNADLPRRGYTADWWRQVRSQKWGYYSQGDDVLGLIDYNIFGSANSDEMHPRRQSTLIEEKLKKELGSFSKIWKGGLLPNPDHRKNSKRNMRKIFEYLEKNIEKNLNILEMGCGRGWWTKQIYEKLDPNQLTCIDAKSAEDNNFWRYIGESKKDKTLYHQVNDFNLDEIPDNSLDFVFSYSCFCHISLSGQEWYLKNLFKKCRPGAKLLIMYADVEKYLKSEPENFNHIRLSCSLDKWEECKYLISEGNTNVIKLAEKESDTHYNNGQWFWVGKDKFLNLCRKFNYEIINEDLDIDKTNPMTLFQKPII